MKTLLTPMLYSMLAFFTSISFAQEANTTHLSISGELFRSDLVEVSDELVSCTLAQGSKTKCLKITVRRADEIGHEMGPWCPRDISDGPEKSGIWLDDGKVFDADGEFVKNLAEFYKDDSWELYNPETGAVKVTDSKEACLAAARPDVDPKYRNHCVECLPSYFADNPEITYLIPAEPIVKSESADINPRGGIGLALNGIKLDAPAPVHAILGANTIAPFDDCGGHVNPHVGYHYHAVTECAEKMAASDEHAALIGFAMDGFMMFSQKNSDDSNPEGLDSCGGHEAADVGYHYHVNGPGKNQILSCFKGESGCTTDGDSLSCENTRRGRPKRSE